MIKAIIFDCFGVLITDALSEMVDEFSDSDPKRAQRIFAIITAVNKGTVSPEDSRNIVAAEFGISPEAYVQRIRDGEVKNAKLFEYIRQSRMRGYKTAMLSNVSISGLGVRFTPDELDQHFDVVVASGMIGYAKPEARAYEITADKLGVRTDECVMIDDREDYCEGARAVGMQAVPYKSFAQLIADLEAVLN